LKIAIRLEERIRQRFLLAVLKLVQTFSKIPKRVHAFWNFIGRWRAAYYILIFFCLFGFLHTVFLADWKVSQADSTIYIVANSQTSGVFRIDFATGLNATPAKIYSNHIAISRSESAIDLSITNLTQETVSKIYVERIQIRSANLSLNWPRSRSLGTLIDCTPPNNFDGTIYLTNRIMASTRFGLIPIYQVSFSTVWTDGENTYLDEPTPFHEAYRIPDLLDWFLIVITLTVTGVIGSWIQVPFCTKRYPYFTLVSFSMLIGLFVFLGTGFNVLYYNFGSFIHRILVATLSPFFHWDYGHLVGNMSAFLLAGLVMESGLKWRKLKYRAFFYCFPLLSANYVLVILQCASLSRFTFGLSFAIISMSAEYLFVTLAYRNQLFSEHNLTTYFALTLVMGYVLVGGAYNWLFTFLIDPSSPNLRQLVWHGLVLLVCVFFYERLMLKFRKRNVLEI